MRISIASNEAIKYACLHFHYAKAVPVNPVGYNVYNDNDEWCGVILYARGANANIGTEYNLPVGGVVELVRVALNGKQEHTSQAVSMTLKQFHKDCPMTKLVVSYADCDQQHLGTIYQATNWIYVGCMKSTGRAAFIVNGKKMHTKSVHSRIVTIDGKRVHCPQNIESVRKYIDPNATEFFSEGKRKYLMPFDKRLRKEILKKAQPYPKNDDWVRIDRSIFKNSNKQHGNNIE